MSWQPPRIIFPDVEMAVCALLRGALGTRTEAYAQDVYIGTTVPNPRLPRMITIRHDGGSRLDGSLELAQLGINVWANVETDVNDLARLTRALLWAAPNGKPITRVDDISGPVAVPDESGQFLRYLTVEATLRGEPLTA